MLRSADRSRLAGILNMPGFVLLVLSLVQVDLQVKLCSVSRDAEVGTVLQDAVVSAPHRATGDQAA